MSSTTSTLNARLASFKAKSAELTVQEVKVPDSSADIMTLFESNSAARSDSANEWTIDVFPNIAEILAYVLLMSLQHARLTDHRDHAKSSVATIALYHMAIVYGFFLLNDLHIRPSPSAHARSWSQTAWKHDFAKFLLTLPVPEFLVPVLSQLHACQTDRTKNVFFIPSAAGFDHDHFFGRFFPLNMFAAIHDCTATLPGNSPRMDVLRNLFSRVLYRITAPAFLCTIPDLIGVTIDRTAATTANYINSKLYQVFTAVFNPVLFRDFQRRSSLATLSFRAPTFADNNVNAYDVLFAASSANLREMKVVLQAVSSVLSGHVVMKQNLGQFISSASGSAILKHGYSEFALPTWSHSTNNNKDQLFNAITLLNHQSETDRATDINFLQRPRNAIPPVNANAVIDARYATTAAPDTTVQIPANHQITRYWPFSLRVTANPNPLVRYPAHNNNDLVLFDEDRHVVPRVLVLDTDGTKTVSAHLATLSGKIIEAFELDASAVDHPNAWKSLGLQNSMFADSAIAYKYVRRSKSYRPRNFALNLMVRTRAAPVSTQRLPFTTLLHDRTQFLLPRFLTATNNANPTVPGVRLLDNVVHSHFVQSIVSARTVDATDNAAHNDEVANMPLGRLHVWSPYTYTPFESDDEPLPAIGESRHYFLTNLRTLFGTDFNMVELKHPFEALPVV